MFGKKLFVRFKREAYVSYRRLVWRYRKGININENLKEYHREFDPRENFDTTPANGEFVDLICMWAVEFYTPAHTDGLIESFVRLGWGEDSIRGRSGLQDPIGWLEGMRRHHLGGSWMNLGILTPSKSDLFVGGMRHEVPLPPNVKYAQAGLHSLTPSLNCIVVCFVFDEKSSGLFDKALRTDHSTFLTPTKGGGWRFHTPSNQKADHIDRCRERLSNLAFAWFSEHLPGIFCSGLLNGQMPTCELITTRMAEPFAARTEEEPSALGFRWALGIGRDFDTWNYKNTPSMRLQLPTYHEQDPRYHAILAMRESTSSPCPGNESNDKSIRDSLYHLNLDIPNWLSVWAILPLLEGYTGYIREMRDSATFRPRKRQNSLRALEFLEKHVSFSIDIAAVVAELTTELKTSSYLFRLSGQFEPSHERMDQAVSLAGLLRSVIGERANWLRRTDKSLRAQLSQYGSILGSAENVRLQRKIGCLTWVLVGFGVVTLFSAALAFAESPWFDDFLSVLGIR